MAAGTDQLPDLGPIEIEDLPAIPGRNTRDAMLLGVSSALQGGVERLVARYRELAGFGCPVIYSGGDGFLACRDISAPAHHAPDLVLRSIAAI
jgi:pantothenate kinase type III